MKESLRFYLTVIIIKIIKKMYKNNLEKYLKLHEGGLSAVFTVFSGAVMKKFHRLQTNAAASRIQLPLIYVQGVRGIQ